MNLSNLNQARKLKSQFDKAQKELKNTVVETEAGKGAVRIVMDGQQKVKSVQISPEVLNPEKPKVVEGLVLKAINDAMSKSQKVAAKQFKEMTGGLKIPGLF